MTQSKAEPLVGAHTSSAGGVHNALLEGESIGATTIQLFTANQRQWHSSLISDEEITLWEKCLHKTKLQKIMSHGSYLTNLGSPKEDVLNQSHNAFEKEILRCHSLKIPLLNIHPGSATESTEEECLNQIIKSLKKFESLCSKGPTRLIFEATAGQGSCVGYKFEHLGYLINNLKHILPVGICLDTCHIFAAGYDIRDEAGWDHTLKEFDKHVGTDHLYALHVNDSVKPLGSKIDRHAPLGDGEIGWESFKITMQHPKLAHLPKYLETPLGPECWKKEIAALKKFALK